MKKDASVGISLEPGVGLFYPVAPPGKEGKGADFKIRTVVSRFGIGMTLVQTVQLMVFDSWNLPILHAQRLLLGPIKICRCKTEFKECAKTVSALIGVIDLWLQKKSLPKFL